MKKLKINLRSVCFLSLLIISCNKEKQDITPDMAAINRDTVSTTFINSSSVMAETAVIRKLDKEIRNGVVSSQYTYDAHDRCIKEDYKDWHITYTYGVNKVVATTVSSDPTKANVVKTYTLNALGLATICTYVFNNKDYRLEYEYNDRRQLTKRTFKTKTPTRATYTTESTNKYTYNSDGDCTSYIYQLTFTNVQFQYSYDKNHFNTLSNEYKGLEWLGKNSVHIPTMMITLTGFYYPNWDSKLDWTYYTWTYDTAGYAIKKVTTGASTGTDLYTYK